MNRKELICRTTERLKEKNVKKKVRAQKAVLHISDDEGNSSDFVIRKDSSDVLFNVNDVEDIVDTLFEVMVDVLKNGEKVYLHGFGAFELCQRAQGLVKHPITGEVHVVESHYVPKFVAGKDLKMAAKIFDLTEAESNVPPYFDRECD